MLFAPAWFGPAQFPKRGNFFRGLADPGLELLPTFGGNRYHRPAKHIDFGRLQSLPAYEVA